MTEGTKETLQKMFDTYKDPILEFSGLCHDCEKDVSVVIEMEEDGKNHYLRRRTLHATLHARGR